MTAISLLRVPATLAAFEGNDFVQSARVTDAVERAIWGHDDHGMNPAERLARHQPTADRDFVLGVARDRGRIVANVGIGIPLRDNRRSAVVQIEVLPSHRRQGIATALLAFAEHEIADRGRSILMAWSDARIDEGPPAGPILVPASGAGSFPASDPSAILAVRSGFELVQVDRQSVLHLADLQDGRDGITRLEREARAVGSGDYELVGWTDSCPEDLIDDYSLLRRRMSTDPPLGGFAQEEEAWDADRIRREEDRSRTAGASSLVCAVRHVASGQLVGHTILDRSESKPAVVYQEDTLVLGGHRGHRLGLWLKAANLRRVLDEWPAAQRIYTWNAEENTHMLNVNGALGFRPSGRTAGWQKVLG